jgi:hypothetical protein
MLYTAYLAALSISQTIIINDKMDSEQNSGRDLDRSDCGLLLSSNFLESLRKTEIISHYGQAMGRNL